MLPDYRLRRLTRVIIVLAVALTKIVVEILFLLDKRI